MAEKPVIDAEFQLVDSKHPYGLLGFLLWVVWIAAWGVAEFRLQEPWERVGVLILASFYQAIWMFARRGRAPSGAEIDLLRNRLDPRQRWRKTAIRDRR